MKDYSFWIIPLIKTEEGIKILEIQHNAWHWWLPKWHPEWNETPIETALREFREETWIIESPEILSDISFSQHYGFERDWIMIEKTVRYFPAYIKQSLKLNLQEIEIMDYRIIPYLDLLEENVPEETKIMLKEIVSFIDSL